MIVSDFRFRFPEEMTEKKLKEELSKYLLKEEKVQYLYWLDDEFKRLIFRMMFEALDNNSGGLPVSRKDTSEDQGVPFPEWPPEGSEKPVEAEKIEVDATDPGLEKEEKKEIRESFDPGYEKDYQNKFLIALAENAGYPTLKELSKALGLRRNIVREWFRGKFKPSEGKREKLSEVLGVPWEELDKNLEANKTTYGEFKCEGCGKEVVRKNLHQYTCGKKSCRRAIQKKRVEETRKRREAKAPVSPNEQPEPVKKK